MSSSGESPPQSHGAHEWLMLIYRVPSEPTRLRASVWRRLRKLGAIYVQNSVAAAPRTPQSERHMRSLRNEIVDKMAGMAFLISTTSIIGEADLVEMYNGARDDEYDEILDKCVDFHAGVAKEVEARHFTYGELEENEEDLHKLHGWYEKVRDRDMLGARRESEVVVALAECAETLERFAAQVYEADSNAL